MTNRETGNIEYKSIEDEIRGTGKGEPLVVTGPADRGRIVQDEDSS